ncbi:MAG: signal recognition particle receptor subunit alpha, partial [Firmicutes bacterium]|nr:signal recognition particle receptor subunit alpha [Bacillota bacterium]
MAVFSGLSEKLSHVFSKLTRSGKLTELEIKAAMREVKLALLEADVNFGVVKEFINKATEAALGEKVLNSLTPGQMVIKVVSDELTKLMGENNEKLIISPKPPSIYMMCG